MKEYIKYIKGKNLSTNTITAYENTLNLFKREYKNFTKKNIVSFIYEESKKPSTLILRRNILLNYYKYIKHIDYDWIKDLKLPSQVEVLRDILSKSDVLKIANSHYGSSEKYIERNKMLILFLYFTGLRASEVSNLKWNHIDGNRINTYGKGRKHRIVFIKEELLNWNNKWQSEYIFCNMKGKQLTTKRISIIVKQMTKRTTIKKEVTPHTFRRSYCTNFIKAGGNIKIVSKLMGHSKIETTARYMHFTEKDMANEYKRLIK